MIFFELAYGCRDSVQRLFYALGAIGYTANDVRQLGLVSCKSGVLLLSQRGLFSIFPLRLIGVRNYLQELAQLLARLRYSIVVIMMGYGVDNELHLVGGRLFRGGWVGHGIYIRELKKQAERAWGVQIRGLHLKIGKRDDLYHEYIIR